MKQFPLDALVNLRDHAVTERKDVLRERLVQVEQAQHARARAEQRERDHDATRRRVDEEEQARVAEGEASVHDLMLLAHYQAGAEVVAVNLRQHSQTSQQKLQRAEHEQSEAELALAEARAEQRVIEREKDRFTAAQRALRESAAEEEALEVWGSRRIRG